VVGHLLWAFNGLLPLLGQERVMEDGSLARYARGTPPLRDPAEAQPLDELMAVWDRAAARVDEGLAGLTPEVLDRPVPNSPTNDPNETVRSLISTLCFHQAYHIGQTGVLRRIAGKEGAIA
jgi:DinB family protein